jgi:hypothetical protein
MLTQKKDIIRDLGDGLILRRSSPEDADALADFNSRIHSEGGWDKPDDRLGEWTRDLLTKPHPTFGSGDFTVVEESSTGKIVSSLNHISQTWTYGGIPFKVGRPELVGTLPEYRRKRLIAVQFEEIHKWSAERGELVQGITGIPHYYKQFGYEMGLELAGGRVTFEPLVPKLKEGEEEPYRIRPAEISDIPFLMEVYEFAGKRQLIRTHRDEAIWRYELTGKSERNINRTAIRVIESTSGEAVGYLVHPWFNWNLGLVIFEYELKPGFSWLDVTPSVARYGLSMGKEHVVRDSEKPETKTGLAFWHGSEHPVYEVWKELLPRVRPTYAWYVRVPDLPVFIRHIAPVLERRISESYLPGYTGQLRLNFYREGLRLVFEKGNLKEAESYKPEASDMGEIGLPDRTFLQLLFGYRSIDEVRAAYADCYWETQEAYVVTSTLFPRKPSFVPGIV